MRWCIYTGFISVFVGFRVYDNSRKVSVFVGIKKSCDYFVVVKCGCLFVSFVYCFVDVELCFFFLMLMWASYLLSFIV